jgi:hypothetical protein
MKITTVGIDLAKSVFQIHGVDARGKAVLRKQLKRGEMVNFFVTLPPCLIGMEACSSAHHWARKLIAVGHEVRLMAPNQWMLRVLTRSTTDSTIHDNLTSTFPVCTRADFSTRPSFQQNGSVAAISRTQVCVITRATRVMARRAIPARFRKRLSGAHPTSHAVPAGSSSITNAKPRDHRGAVQDRHIAVASFRRVTATCAGVSLPAVGSSCSDFHL